MILSLAASVGLMVGCDGDDGAQGPAGPPGPQGPQGEQGPPGQDLTAVLEPESCAVCHSTTGQAHQVVYNAYGDASDLKLEILDVDSVAAGTGFEVTATFSVMKGGLPFVDADGLPTLEQKTFYVQGYDSATRTFPNAMNAALRNPVAVDRAAGKYKVSATGVTFAPENSNAFAYGYIADGHLDTEPGDHIHLYDNVSNAAKVYGDVGEYESYANVDGCEKCHGEPYLKHGFRAAEVEGLPTFASCKACHRDDRPGGHQDWQQMVDDPVGWGNDEDSKLPEYAYTARVMNDVHMSHAMEFPYPQSMASCGAACHAGELDNIFADEFFTVETCKSCHPVQVRPEEYRDPHRAPSLQELWDANPAGAIHNIDLDCSLCHNGETLAAFHHGGFNPEIYNADGERYADLYTAEITGLSYEEGVVHIHFTGNTELMTEPMVLVSFYGYGAKQFIVGAHSRDADGNRYGEFRVGGGDSNPRFTEMADSVQGNWHVAMDLSQFPEDVPVLDMIDEGVIKRLEVSIRPTVEIDDMTVATNGVSSTLDLASNTIDDDYFKGANAVVDVEGGCNDCHDALATTFHTADRGGNITLCKQCHVPSSGGSHLEMQSREIASYVHAIHQFQAFDFDEIDFSDNYFAKKYCEHVGSEGNSICEANPKWDYIGFVFPNFTIKNCEACHMQGTFNVPDQAESLPAVLSDSESNDTWDRKIGYVPSYVVGPASKACGACHRAHLINDDDASGLTAFNQHTKANGYLVEEAVTPWEDVVAEIMAYFE